MNDNEQPSVADTPQAALPSGPRSDPYTPGKLFGVALLGAGASLVAYYVFQQLEPATKARLKGTAVRGARAQLRGWINGPEETPE